MKNREMLIHFIYHQALLTVLMSLNYDSAGKNNNILRDHQRVHGAGGTLADDTVDRKTSKFLRTMICTTL